MSEPARRAAFDAPTTPRRARSEWGDHGDERQQQPIHRALEWGAGVSERTRLAGDPRRVAPLPDCLNDELACTLDDERSGSNVFAGSADDGARLPCEDGLVEGDSVRVDEMTVRDNLVSRLDAQQVAGDDLVDGGCSRDPVTNDGRRRRDERSKPVERALRADFLRDPDRRVREED